MDDGNTGQRGKRAKLTALSPWQQQLLSVAISEKNSNILFSQKVQQWSIGSADPRGHINYKTAHVLISLSFKSHFL